VMFEGGAKRGEPSKRLRKCMQTNLFAISRRVLAKGRGNPPFLFFGNSEDVIRWVHSKSLEVEREWGDTPPLDRQLARGRWGTKEGDTAILGALGGDEVPTVNRDGMLFGG